MPYPFLSLGFNSWSQKFSRGNVSGGGGGATTFLQYVTTSISSFTLRSTGTVDYEVDWGDESTESLTTNTASHTYSSAGQYTIKITPAEGSTYRPFFANALSDLHIASVSGSGGSQLGTDLSNAWHGALNMTSFSGDIDTSNVTTFSQTWDRCSSLASLGIIDTSSGLNFYRCWGNCDSLTSFPALDFSSATGFSDAWRNAGLVNFPANMFDTTGTFSSGAAFLKTFQGCDLNVQSIENILVSLDTNGATNITLSIDGGNNAGKTTWSAAANTAYTNLINKGWSIFYKP